MKHFSRAMLLAALAVVLATNAVSAHQPYFEETDLTDAAPYVVQNPEISLAYYATLDMANDVDYYAFEGKAGERILLELTIPQIAGQENFAPQMALMGPQLPAGNIAPQVAQPNGAGVKIFPPPANARTFYEPFSGTSYWERQKEFVTLPADGRYLVAVWHPQGTAGRYVFVTGTREVMGGDMTFPLKMREYWTPVQVAPRNTPLLEQLWSKFWR